MDSGLEGVLAVAEDRKKERGCQLGSQERGETHPWRGEPMDGHKSSLGIGQLLDKVGGCGH